MSLGDVTERRFAPLAAMLLTGGLRLFFSAAI
jgi:hypothetical protein